VASIGGRFLDGAVALVFDASQLLKVRLVVMGPARGDFGVENDAALGVDRLTHLVFELQGRTAFLRQRGLGVGATAVRSVRHAAVDRRIEHSSSTSLRFGLDQTRIRRCGRGISTRTSAM